MGILKAMRRFFTPVINPSPCCGEEMRFKKSDEILEEGRKKGLTVEQSILGNLMGYFGDYECPTCKKSYREVGRL